jgi:drug/metabolite transporter (DMT)-like permease
MLRDRALKVVLVLLGLGFCAGIYPIADALWHPDPAEAYGDYMMLSLYVTLGVFLLIAARHPPSHRSLIAFTAWSSFAHALVMGTMGFQFANQRVIPSTSPRREQFHSK